MSKLFIGVLAPRTTDDDLHTLFAANGAIVSSVEVQRDKTTGTSRRFAIADAEDPASVIAVCNGKILNGFVLVVKELG